MPELKPVAGYPSRVTAVAALSKRGMSAAAIGSIVGLDRDGVHRTAYNISHPPIRIAKDVLDGLEPHATRRGMSVPQLVSKLLFAVVEDGLVAAIMEDAA